MTILARRKAAQPRGDETSTGIEALFEEHAPMVLAICRYHLRDLQAAEDAAQETFLSAHRSLLGGTRPRDPAAWLATIARNKCRRGLRTAHAAPFDDARTGTVADPADIVADRAALTEVTSAIAHLPPRQREALVMRELWGLSYEQVAAAMHLSASAVDSLLSRARRTLSEQFGDIPKAARGALIVPASLREQLSRFIPELDPAVATAAGVASGGGAATLASLGSAPAAAKIAATGAAAIAIAVPVHTTMRGDAGPRASQRPAAAQTARPAIVRSQTRPVARSRTTAAISDRRPPTTERDSSGPGSGTSSNSGSGSGSADTTSGSGSNSGPGSESSGSGSGSSGSGSGESGSDSGSGSSGSGSGSSGSGSGESGSGSGSGYSGSGSGSSGSGSSGSGSSGSGSGSSGSGSGESGSGESGSGSGEGSGDEEGSGGSGSGGSGSG